MGQKGGHSTGMLSMGGILSFVVLFLSPSGCDCIFPLERDVEDVTGYTLPKSWSVFMERRAWLCMSRRSTGHLYSASYFDFLRCMSHNSKESRCLYNIRSRCIVLETKPNVLIYYHNLEAVLIRFHIHLHWMFSMNVSITEFNLNRASGITYGEYNSYLELGSHDTHKRYFGERLPWSIFMRHFDITVALINFCAAHKCVEIEYNIMPKLYFTPLYTDNSSPENQFSWGNHSVYTFHMYVEVINKICLHIEPAIGSGIVAYDSSTPTRNVLLRLKSEYENQVTINASAFQMFLVLTHCQTCNATTFHYEAVEQNKIVVDIKHKPIKMQITNQSSWRSNQLTWIQIYLLKAEGGHNVDTKMTHLKFYCNFVGDIFTGGVVLYNIVNGRKERVMGLHRNSDINDFLLSEISFKSTQNAMYVAVYAYGTVQCDTTVVLEIQAVDCAGRYFDYFNLPSTAPYLHKMHQHRYKLYLPYHDGDECIQLYAWHIADNTNHLVTTGSIHIFWKIGYPVWIEATMAGHFTSHRCRIKVHGQIYIIQPKYESIFDSRRIHFAGTLQYISYKTCAQTKLSIKIQQTHCEVPCVSIAPQIMTNSNDLCDICSYWYSTAYHILLKQNITLKVYAMKSNCTGLKLMVTRCENKQFIRYHYNIDRPEEMQLNSTKATYRIKDPNQCMSYVPNDIVTTHLDPAECSETPPRLQAIFQRSVYTLIWRHVMTTWEDAATHCLKTDGTLIVPNSRQEYDFIWRSFIERYEIVLIPMGLRRYEVSTVQPMKYSVLLFFDTIFVVILSVLLDVVMMFYSHQNCCFGAILIVKDMGKIVRYSSKP